MTDYELALSNLIAAGSATGQLIDDEIIQVLGGLEEEKMTNAFNEITAAGIKIIPGESEPDEEQPLEPTTPEQEWDGGSMDSVGMYLREIGQYPLLTSEEESTLCRQLADGRKAGARLEEEKDSLTEDEVKELKAQEKAGKKARQKLIEHNLRLVVHFARRYDKKYHDLQLLDLIQSGNMGLMRGIDQFDPDRGVRLSTYATWWIKQAIMRDIANDGQMIRIPVHATEKLHRVRNAQHRLEQESGEAVSNEQLADETGMSVREVNTIRQNDHMIVSLDMRLGEDKDGSTLGEMLPDSSMGPAEQFEQENLAETVHDVMERILNPREIYVITHRNGLDGGKEQTLNEIGDTLGITRERVRQIEAKAMRKLRSTGLRRYFTDFIQIRRDY